MHAQLAQVNLGTLIAPVDDPAIAEFVEALDAVNALADDAPGFVWRLQGDAGNATSIQVSDNPNELVNLSVWESVDALKHYVYGTEHVDFFRRRAEWFEPAGRRVALWWVPAGHRPTVDEAVRRVAFVEAHGPSPYAFGFARPGAPLLFERTTPDDPGTGSLIERLNGELRDLAEHPAENDFSLDAEHVSGDAGVMLCARLDGALVGCGAIRRIAPGCGEVKRMFIDPATRGMKIGAAILDQLELAAEHLAIDEVKLETGPRQPAAIGMYERAGYRRCEPWGEYVATSATSLCYSKMLV